MTTEYRVSLDRAACEGIFACLVRDDRFSEAEDGLADLAAGTREGSTTVATFEDSDAETARQAARACPVDAIEVTEVDAEGSR